MLRRRGFAHRLVAGLLALWFAVVATEGARLHACAMHGGSDAAAAVASEAMSAGSAHAGHAAMHGGHATATVTGDDGAPTHGGRTHQCTCPDTSCGSAIVALSTPRLAAHFAIAIADVSAVFSPEQGRGLVAVPYLTPFANGPPASALA